MGLSHNLPPFYTHQQEVMTMQVLPKNGEHQSWTEAAPDWMTANPNEMGWSQSALDKAFAYAGTIATDALMLIQRGKILATLGDVEHRFMCHSIRKSFLSAMFGLLVERDATVLSRTLQQLGIDDKLGLSGTEKTATVYDLLTARSGIYHPAGYETPWMRSIKPARHAHAPGVNWCYNNWDFNALGTIYTQLSGRGIHEAFLNDFAAPLGMQDFRFDAVRQDGHLEPDDCSMHPAYPFRMSSRDLARFGQLFLQKGRWGERQIVSEHWTATSVQPYSDAGARGGYGYMWWLGRSGVAFPNVMLPNGSYSAQGAGGHYCLVIPELDLVLVHRVDTDMAGRAVDGFQFGHLLNLILAAAPRA